MRTDVPWREDIANAISSVIELHDYDLTQEEKFDIIIMVEKLTNICCRLDREHKSEYESIL